MVLFYIMIKILELKKSCPARGMLRIIAFTVIDLVT